MKQLVCIFALITSTAFASGVSRAPQPATATTAGTVSKQDSGTFTMTFTGSCTITAATIGYSLVGGIASLSWSNMFCSSTSVGNILNSSSTLATELIPARNINMTVYGVDGAGNDITGYVTILTTGHLYISPLNNGGIFATSGNAGMYAGSIAYSLN